MRGIFDRDIYPGKPRILFVGLGESTHTHSWIDLLESADLNVRLFSTSNRMPPANWKVRVYVTHNTDEKIDPGARKLLYSNRRVIRRVRRVVARSVPHRDCTPVECWLARVVREWCPHIVHTLGLDAARFYFDVRRRFELAGTAKWVMQLRGGSDLALDRHDPKLQPHIAEVVCACDQLLSDNKQNFEYVKAMGARAEQLATVGTVPGTGGVDVEELARKWQGTPSKRRIVLVPKLYECRWSKSLPILEAFRLAWRRLPECRVHMLAVDGETLAWYRTLPTAIKERCVVEERVPRSRVLELMTQARVMLAPSLVDGVPNSMYEAMAAGAFPIVSPLETIGEVVKHEQNILFARNLYPEEIAAMLVRAMTDDQLVDDAARRNLQLVGDVADRVSIRQRVVAFYKNLAASSAADSVQ